MCAIKGSNCVVLVTSQVCRVLNDCVQLYCDHTELHYNTVNIVNRLHSAFGSSVGRTNCSRETLHAMCAVRFVRCAFTFNIYAIKCSRVCIPQFTVHKIQNSDITLNNGFGINKNIAFVLWQLCIARHFRQLQCNRELKVQFAIHKDDFSLRAGRWCEGASQDVFIKWLNCVLTYSRELLWQRQQLGYRCF